MKNSFLMIALLVLFAGCSAPQIEGTWKPVTINGEALEASRQTIVFKFLEEGVFSMTNGEENGSGTWSFNSDLKEMVVLYSIVHADGSTTNDVFNWTNVEFNETEMTVTDPAGKIKLERQE